MKFFSKKIKAKAGKKINLRSHIIPASLMVLSLGMFVYVFQSDMPKPEKIDKTPTYRAQAKGFAKGVAENIAQIRSRLIALAESPDAAEKLAKAPSTLLPHQDAQLPNLMAVRLLTDVATDTADDEVPALSYACFDMVFESVKQASKDKPLPVEVHLFGSKSQHIDFVQAVKNENGEAVGAVLASFNIQVLKNALSSLVVTNGNIELQQGRQVLAAKGKRGERALGPYKALIAGTRWNVAYWPESNKTEQIINYASQQILLVTSFASVILLIALFLFIRTALHNRRMQAEMDAREPPKTVLRKVEESVTDEASDDLLFQSGEGLVVEEEDVEPDADATNAFDRRAIASIFKAYDIRGVVNKTLTEEVVYEIGRALGSEAQARQQFTMVVGRDGRNSGPVLVQKLIDGLLASGTNVINVGLVPTPLLYFAAQIMGSGSGVMLTGSHNPPDYNGLKMVIDGTTLARDDIQLIRKRVEESDYHEGEGQIVEKSVLKSYLKRVTSDIMLLKPFKIVVDCGNGAAGVIAPELLKTLGCEVIELFCDVDGDFPNHHPDPSRPENLKDVIVAVKEHKADLGFAFDGDGDRLGVVTSEGNIIWPDRVMMLYAMDILSRNPGAEIIFDVKCSTKLKQVIEQHGGKATMWNTGHSLIKAKMKETGALLAGEMSGHIFFKERWYGFDDGIYSAARLVELLGSMAGDKSVAEIFNALPDSVNTPELNIDMEDGKHHELMVKLLKKAKFDDGEVTTIDGLRVDFPDGWGLVRASNTTSTLVLRFEADTDVALAQIMKRFRELLLSIDAGLKLSF